MWHRILPVIDLKAGTVVRAIAGQRDQYQPVRSRLFAGAEPEAAAKAFRSRGFDDVYVADLDAIGGSEPDAASLNALSASGLQVWLDAGVGDVRRAASLARQANEWRLAAIVIGLESVADPHVLREIVAVVGTDRAVFSLDLRGGTVLSSRPVWRSLPPVEIAVRVAELGVRRLIVLDLAHVGMASGPAVAPLCAEIQRQVPPLRIVSGGGVRTLADVDAFVRAGCDRVLVGSALHDQLITFGGI